MIFACFWISFSFSAFETAIRIQARLQTILVIANDL
jgi:hypothetical protein